LGISRIKLGQFRGISESKMLELVAKLGHDVTIHIGPARKKAGRFELAYA
jgi:hypothetical protein